MSDFIPMVSTTPPPMLDGPPDDDFTDFMDGGNDDFSAFSNESDSFADQSIPSFSPMSTPAKSLMESDAVNNYKNNSQDIPIAQKSHIDTDIKFDDDDFDDFTEFEQPPDFPTMDNDVKEHANEMPNSENTDQNFDICAEEATEQLPKNQNIYDIKVEDNKSVPKSLFDPSNFGTTVGENMTEINNTDNFESISNSHSTDNAGDGDTTPDKDTACCEVIEPSNGDKTNLRNNNGALEIDDSITSSSSNISDETSITLEKQENDFIEPVLNLEKTEHVSIQSETKTFHESLGKINDTDSINNVDKSTELSEDHSKNIEKQNLDISDFKSDNNNFSDEEFGEFENGDVDAINAEDNLKPINLKEDLSIKNNEETVNDISVKLENDQNFGEFDSKNITHFKTQSPMSNENDIKIENVKSDVDDDDNFADFGAFEDSTYPATTDTNVITESVPKVDDDGDFGSFSDDDDLKFSDDETDSFGAFDNKETVSFSKPHANIKNISLPEKVELFARKHAYKELKEEGDIILLDEWFNENFTETNGERSESNDNSATWAGEVWDQLEDVDNTIALSFVWNGSVHNKHLLKSLGMDINNIMFSGNNKAYYVPSYYAIGLDTMDHNKGILKPMSAAEKITAISPKEKSPPITLTPASEPMEKWESPEVVATIDSSRSPVLDALSFDVDFLESHESTTNVSHVKPDLIDPELLELSTSPSINLPPIKDSGSAKLTKLLASLKTNSSSPASTSQQGDIFSPEEDESLSQEAKNVIKKLPDLSYMRSKVLMFPVNIMSRVKMSDQ